MRVHTGTSGFSFDEWRGQFYPSDLRADARLEYYANHLEAVEINNTFYQMPKAALLERWRDTVPDAFRFALKAPRRITHTQKLKITRESLDYFFATATALGHKLGPVLFQLPPFLPKDRELLADFLALLPATQRFAFEFRHASWFDDEIFTLLSDRSIALCGGDADGAAHSPPMIATTDFGYLRLRAACYDEASLRTWSERITSQPWTEAYAFLKHEVLGPSYARFLAAATAGRPEPPLAPAKATRVSQPKSKVTPTRRRLVPE